jgi:putative acetyltransferase
MLVAIAPEPFDSDDARRLVGALDAELSLLYEPEQRFGPNLKAAHLSPGQGTFLVARTDGKAVGCGALRRLDVTTGEVKRMYVEPDLRGRGIAKQILDRIESAAAELGIHRLVLETGIHQEDAIALYTRAGFRAIPCWGEYAGSPTSVCLEKVIGSVERSVT